MRCVPGLWSSMESIRTFSPAHSLFQSRFELSMKTEHELSVLVTWIRPHIRTMDARKPANSQMKSTMITKIAVNKRESHYVSLKGLHLLPTFSHSFQTSQLGSHLGGSASKFFLPIWPATIPMWHWSGSGSRKTQSGKLGAWKQQRREIEFGAYLALRWAIIGE